MATAAKVCDNLTMHPPTHENPLMIRSAFRSLPPDELLYEFCLSIEEHLYTISGWSALLLTFRRRYDLAHLPPIPDVLMLMEQRAAAIREILDETLEPPRRAPVSATDAIFHTLWHTLTHGLAAIDASIQRLHDAGEHVLGDTPDSDVPLLTLHSTARALKTAAETARQDNARG